MKKDLLLIHHTELLDNIEKHVSKLFEDAPVKQFPYHNLAHTKSVVENSKEISSYYSNQLSEEVDLAILIASWFHDTGHIYGKLKGHEEIGIQLMDAYITPFDLPAEMIKVAHDCIIATKYPTHPNLLAEEIICDADTYHLGTSYFRITDKLVKQEMELRLGKIPVNWKQHSLEFLKSHRFYTSYCQERLNKGKQENIDWLISGL